ncbi:MAG: ribosome small subunit-dependent GTPase A [Kangiellaceae bacterium]|nr:ribosome small subunit-dependent GTPase A [Kangiellaceae bacterium]
MAKRDKLTERQKRQIAKTQRKKTSIQNAIIQMGDLGELKKGLMISRFGEQADVMDIETGKVTRCFLRQHVGAPVSGDRICFRVSSNQQGVIESIEERTSLLQRPSHHHGLKPVVANINRVFVMVAPLPDFSSVLLDRYLVAIENAGIDITIVANKWDLAEEIEEQSIEKQLSNYQRLGYSVIKISTKNNKGKKEFTDAIQNNASILVGQSGVGKSSVINWLFSVDTLATQSISENSRLGQHTTTASQLFCLGDDPIKSGFIIDSPGIREFSLWHLDISQVASGF